MTSFKSTRPVETILVAKGNKVLINDTANGATLPAGGAAPANVQLMNSNGTVNLADGQLGIFDATGYGTVAMNAATTTASTIQTAPEIYIAQGTATSQAPGQGAFPLTNNRPSEKSNVIVGKNTVIYSARVCAMPTFSTWEINSITGVTSSTEYALKIALRGRRQDEMNSTHGTATLTPAFTTPDYTVATTIINAADQVIKNLAHQINRSSRAFNVSRPTYGAHQPVIAFAVDSTAAATGVVVSTLTVGTILPVFISGGQKNLTITEEILNTINLVLAGTEKILNINLTTAGTAATGANKIVVMAMDEELAYVDRIPHKKVRLDVGLSRGFNSLAVCVQSAAAFEGEGQARHWQLYYEATAGQRKYAQYSETFPVITYPSDIVANQVYTAFVIEHKRNDQIDFNEVRQANHKTIILIPCCDSDTIASFRRVFEPWLTSCVSGVFRSIPASFTCPAVYA